MMLQSSSSEERTTTKTLYYVQSEVFILEIRLNISDIRGWNNNTKIFGLEVIEVMKHIFPYTLFLLLFPLLWYNNSTCIKFVWKVWPLNRFPIVRCVCIEWNSTKWEKVYVRVRLACNDNDDWCYYMSSMVLFYRTLHAFNLWLLAEEIAFKGIYILTNKKKPLWF